MKKKYFIAIGFILAATLVAYGFFQLNFQGEDEEQIAIAKAQALTGQFINKIYRAHFTGNLSELREFVAKKDSDGVIKNLLREKGIDLEAPPRMRMMGVTDVVGLPDFSSSSFIDGSVLLSRTLGSTTSDLIASIIPGLYTHCGVLDQKLCSDSDLNAGCIITANLDGVTYETYDEWNVVGDATGKIVTKLNPSDGPPSGLYGPHGAKKWIQRYMGWTIYSFLRLNLEAVSRWDPFRWYCSKTVWRVLYKAGLRGDINDVENANWYGINPNAKYEWFNTSKLDYELQYSILYQLYKGLLMKFGISEGRATTLTNNKLWRVLKEVITPDEVRFAATNPSEITPAEFGIIAQLPSFTILSGTEGGPLSSGSLESWMK